MLGACASEPEPTVIRAYISASEDVNPTPPDGKPTRIVVQLYELASPSAFDNADFWTLYEAPPKASVEGVVDRYEVEVEPGEAEELEHEFQTGSRYVGVVAAYHDLNSVSWHAVKPVEPNQTTELTIIVDREKVAIEEKQ
jgi:type VI secretion system protein VasD